MTRVILSGCNGHMGQTITGIAAENPDTEIVAGIDINAGTESGYPVYDSIDKCKEEADVIIDFSSPAVLDDLLSYGIKNGIPLVLCTTGYDEAAVKKIEEASKETAVLRSANMSLGINILAKVLKGISGQLKDAGFDIEIVEKHHRLKKDAPSGTALLLADAVNSSVSKKLEYVYDRSGRSEKRPDDEIGISAIRGGTIPGDHDVIFAGTDEVITLSHRAYSKAVFARGAVQAAVFLNGKKPGMYSMSDVINNG
ncbi:MAG: 4-hydroxy-tetrahydrodipicolinate reductase [Lachnospiraceae bacterium]|nr:4-hydroxy-tetrahydrodipicolinate reductase [Lachnospiraceae bacterium]